MLEEQRENSGQFSIRVRKGDWEIEVSAPEKLFVLDQADQLIERISKYASTAPLSSKGDIIQGEVMPVIEANQFKAPKPQTLNEFYRQFKLQTHLDKILLFGYWCEQRQEQSHFTSDDILAKYKETKQAPPANIRRDIGSLVSKGFFMDAGRSEEGNLAYELTSTGIEEVELKLLRS